MAERGKRLADLAKLEIDFGFSSSYRCITGKSNAKCKIPGRCRKQYLRNDRGGLGGRSAGAEYTKAPPVAPVYSWTGGPVVARH